MQPRGLHSAPAGDVLHISNSCTDQAIEGHKPSALDSLFQKSFSERYVVRVSHPSDGTIKAVNAGGSKLDHRQGVKLNVAAAGADQLLEALEQGRQGDRGELPQLLAR